MTAAWLHGHEVILCTGQLLVDALHPAVVGGVLECDASRPRVYSLVSELML